MNNHGINDNINADLILQITYDNVLDNIVPGVSLTWLYSTICNAENASAALQDIITPINDEIVANCFVMDLALTYGDPCYESIEPGQVLMIDTGTGLALYVVDSLTGSVSIFPWLRYEKGFMVQKGAINQDGHVVYSDVNHGYIVGYPDRNKDEFEVVDIKSGERLPAHGFLPAQGFEAEDEVKEFILNSNKGIVDTMAGGIPDLISYIYTQIKLYQLCIWAKDNDLPAENEAYTVVEDQLRVLKEDLELMMAASAESGRLEELLKR